MTVDEFIAKWENCPGHERANYAVFLTEFTHLLGVDAPGPNDDYRIDAPVPGGAEAGGTGFIDLYKRGCFILEAKQSKYVCELPSLPGLDDVSNAPSGARYDDLMRRAFRQARRYAQSLAQPPWPPFLIVLDVGRAFELYFDFGGNGRDYRFFPDRQSYRIPLADLRSDREVGDTHKSPLDLLRAIWTDPRSVDPRAQAADVTRTVAQRLASVSQYIEEGARLKLSDRSPREKAEEVEEAALFLMRILFCMFAEDVGLLPKDKFTEFLRRAESNDKLFQNQLADLWQKMGTPGTAPRFAHALEEDVKYFNGGLFSDTARTYPLGGFVIHDLYEAARQNWRRVEPAIFGTLLEQALSAEERAKLGAHYTPRPYVETLVRATIMDVLEPEWAEIEEEIGLLQSSPERGGGSPSGLTEGWEASASRSRPLHHPSDGPPPRSGEDRALTLALAFHDRLASIRVLDPACGTGNFLYVAMELMQALEARVIETIQTLGGHAEPRVGPHQFHGLEKNPRAAKIAELVLWIGWLRNRLHDDPDSVPQPVLAESASINFGKHGGYDAVLKMNDLGQPDLDTPMIPDWPEAEFIVGNPPFIGKGGLMRAHLGDDYVEALQAANPRVPASADFVMQWWDRAAHTLVARNSPLIRFGFVTTNSITQEFSRRVIANYLSPSPLAGEGGAPSGAEGEGTDSTSRHQRESGGAAASDSAKEEKRDSRLRGNDEGGDATKKLSLVMAIPDHPWTKATRDAAAVRIAMTVAERGAHEGELREITIEEDLDTDQPKIGIISAHGTINADLTAGADVTKASPLKANAGLSNTGMLLAGQGFKIPGSEAKQLVARDGESAWAVIRPYVGGGELMDRPQGKYVIDLHGLTEKQARQSHPATYERVLITVKPERDENRQKSRRENWWLFGRSNSQLRAAKNGLKRFIATPETAKHRVFQFVDGVTVPDHMAITVSSEDGFHLGVLQSTIHLAWALRTGGTLEDRPRYNKASCFDPFPFP
ncbi:DNA methyltransferase, partial [Sphingomonas sp.]|uniref:class I SAM-dependent DNA methyltransferase n=1 Tax=Sphingomonas sp. TaxID=28214 RepID=UPI0025F9D83C